MDLGSQVDGYHLQLEMPSEIQVIRSPVNFTQTTLVWFGTYSKNLEYAKKIDCFSEIQIYMGPLHFYLLNILVKIKLWEGLLHFLT